MVIESVLREHDLGPTQWYVLYQLVHDGPTMQRLLSQLLRIERATMSGVVATLIRKGLVAQMPDAVDQRQRILCITEAGQALAAGGGVSTRMLLEVPASTKRKPPTVEDFGPRRPEFRGDQQ